MKMKKFIIQYKLLGMVLLFVGFSSMGQPFEKSRKVIKSFSLSPETEVQVSNKYGNIELIPWEKDSVRFEISLKVIANKESKLNSTYDYIDFDFKSSKYYVIANTSFAGKGSFWSDVKDLANTVFTSGTKTQIDYIIYLPKDITIRIKNKYGDIYTSDHDGPVDIYLSNGYLKSHSFNGKTFLNLQFADANINYVANGEFYLGYYSDLQLDEADSLIIESRSSRLNINKSNYLEINSSRDKYFLESVGELVAINSFSYLEVKNLGKHINVDANYGDIILKNIYNTVDYIQVNGESTDISIYKDKNQMFNLEVTYNERAGIFFSEKIIDKKTIKENEEKKLVKTTGKMGDINSNEINVKVHVLSGKFRIINK